MKPQIKLKHSMQLVNSLNYQILLHFKLVSSLKCSKILFTICKSKMISGKAFSFLKGRQRKGVKKRKNDFYSIKAERKTYKWDQSALLLLP